MLINKNILDFIKGTFSLIDEKYDFCFNDREVWGMRNETRDSILVYNPAAEPGDAYRFKHNAPFAFNMRLEVDKNAMTVRLVSDVFKSILFPLEEAPAAPVYGDFEKGNFSPPEERILSFGGQITASSGVIASSGVKNTLYFAACDSKYGFTADVPPGADRFILTQHHLELEYDNRGMLLRKKIPVESVNYSVSALPGEHKLKADAQGIKQSLQILPQLTAGSVKLEVENSALVINSSFGKLDTGLITEADISKFSVSKDGLGAALNFIARNFHSDEFPGTIECNSPAGVEGYILITMESGYSVCAF